MFLAGALFLFWFQGFLREVEALSLEAPRAAFQRWQSIPQVLFVLVLCSSTVAAGLLGHLALRIWRAGQWPPPGLRVMWETPIRTGYQATLVAVCCLLLALIVLAYGPLMMMVLTPALLGQ